MTSRWEIKTLGEVLQKTETTNPLLSPEVEFEYIDVSSVSNSTFQIEETQHLIGKDAPSRARKLVRTNDVLFATIRPTLRRIAIVPESLDRQVCSTGYFVLRPKAGIDYRYIFYWLFGEGFMGQMEVLQKGASYPAVTDAEVRAQAIPFPPLPEQQRIVGILDEAFDGIATAKNNAEKNLRNARDIYASVVESMYTDFGEPYSTKELGACIETLTDYHANGSYEILKLHVDLKDTEDYAWMVRSTDFENNFLNNKRYITKQAYEFLTKSHIFGGEIIMSKIGNAGKVYLMPEISRPCSLAMNLFLIRLDEKKVTHKYVYHYLKTCSGEAQIQSRLKGVATQTITKENVRSLQIPICSHDKQVSIVSSLEKLSAETHRLESIYQQKLAALDALKKSLLDQAFSGEI